ncbi:MAG: hypothetical protein ACR2N2_11355 [Acidimicrobiia bacterium]
MKTYQKLAAVSAVFGAGSTAAYIALVAVEGNNALSDIAPWVIVMLTASGLSLLGAILKDERRSRRALVIATIIFAAIGILAIFSIGFLYLIAAALSGVAAAKTPVQ